ncbi:ubiquinol-cytochrome c reductase iron-sulfur subunit [Azonexus hydrophilus]|jgi:ubiquinol-cytochrome c reductase iron-sulfur subunit|uniref:ubiquinol-cytochrome c reductase iron-sulfur subunit n=1 Tax=Azonexus hydrophilus TaxID=418702 RepID=UPI00176B6A40|nr:ubiquinol-cytochrome c reductase iron-sulfur subunit [Azonexus hydrophilus]HHV49352.1 ubiquinol-cytochrome c reductase iron-sulfur subunit [Rhodocyclaceae bacterium]
MSHCMCHGNSFTTGNIDPARRQWIIATAGVGGILGMTALIPFVSSLLPSERALAAGAPVEVDIGRLQAGEMLVVEWRGKPVWILNRTPEMLAALKKAEPMLADPASRVASQQPEYAANPTRSRVPEMLVVIGICTHLGCSPSNAFTPGDPALGADWPGGFLCPCHGSTFDFAGRVFKNKPAPTNLEVPPHQYLSDTRLLIGSDEASKT